jgi:hypothetical protein
MVRRRPRLDDGNRPRSQLPTGRINESRRFRGRLAQRPDMADAVTHRSGGSLPRMVAARRPEEQVILNADRMIGAEAIWQDLSESRHLGRDRGG